MKKFSFRLQPLVRVREAVRDERRGQLAEALGIQAALAERRQALTNLLGEARLGHTAPAGRVDVDRLLDAERYEMLLLAESRQLAQQEASVAAEVEKRRQALVWADQDVRVLEKLRDAQRLRWQGAMAREEMNELDEIAGRGRPLEALP